MTKTLVRLSCIVFLLLSIFSCKKNSNSASRTELLTQKGWIQTNQETGSGGNWQIDAEFASSASCDKDDQLVFKSDKTVELNAGATKCDEAESQTSEQGNWNFTDNETKLTFSGGTVTIDQLDEDILILTGTETGNSSLQTRLTFKH